MLRFFQNSILAVVCIVLLSCEEYEDVQFRQMKDIRVVGVEKGEILVKGFAEFYNPNKAGIKLKDAVIDIFVKEKLVAHLTPSAKVRIKPKDVFQIPIDARISLQESGFLNNILSIFGKKEMELHYVGHIKVSKYLMSRRIDINEKQKIRF